MTISTRALCGLSTALALIGLASPAGADEASPVPRYRLKAGQELKYHETSEFKYDKGSFAHATDWQVWVVRANDDGSWRLVLRSSRKDNPSGGGPADVSMAYCDLFPDGRIVPNDSFGFRLDPSPLFPRLPEDAERAKDGWQATDSRQGTRTEFTRSRATGTDWKEWVFDGVRRSPMDQIYLSTSRARYVFDGERGLVKRVESRSTQGYGFNGKGTGTIELTAVEEQDAGRVEALAKEADRYFEANRQYQGLLAKASKDAESVNSLLSRAEATLKDAREALTLPVLREQVDAQLKDHERMTSYYAEEAKNRAAVLGREAAEWETKDLEGETHLMKGYRGKVVVLDFWYRGCGWCIRAMPQVKELAEDFRGEPVAVLGMNTDRKEEDARFVVEAMGLNYPTLKAEGLPEKFHVRGFPTLVIVDRQGKVADVHVGYSPTLKEEVAKTVRGLLDAK